MDKLGVQQRSPKHSAQEKASRSKEKKKKSREPIKVVYISNPMMVTTTASEFKDRVQELTGRYSDVAEAEAFTSPEPPRLQREAPPGTSRRSKPDRARAAAATTAAAAIENSSTTTTSTGSSSVVSDPGVQQAAAAAAAGELYASAPLDASFDDVFSMDYESFTDLCYDHRSMF